MLLLKKKLSLCLLCSSLILLGCDKSDSSHLQLPVTSVQGQTMGTFYQITVPGGYPQGEEALKSLAEEEFKTIIAAISTFDSQSELYKFNDYQSTTPFVVSKLLGNIIQEAKHQSLRIDGAMDISVGPLVNLWGFGKDKTQQVPSQEQIDEVKSYVGVDKYEIRATAGSMLLIKRDPRVRLDLSTIGEGLGADAVARRLDSQGIKNYLVSVAGASRSKGLNAKGELWRIGIEDPTIKEQRVFEIVCPLDQAVSTAGSYRNFYSDDGKIYSHIIDPHSGRPVDHQTVSVTVVARDALTTDALDTGLLVWGAQRAIAWGNKYEIPVYAIEMIDGKPVASYTRAFEKYLNCGAK